MTCLGGTDFLPDELSRTLDAGMVLGAPYDSLHWPWTQHLGRVRALGRGQSLGQV